ncbi:MAG TPA: OmpA family protein [Flavitalea sp.]|nr:OmpA family protein [Flavitalea sp.]
MLYRNALLILLNSVLYLNCFSQSDTTLNFYFETNSYTLDTIQYNRLVRFAADYQIKLIVGYADSNGTTSYNYSLSKKRAYAVYSAVNNKELIDDSKVILVKGESTENLELWKNRRVQITGHQVPVKELSRDTMIRSDNVIRVYNLEYVYFIPDEAIVTQESISYIKQLAEILKTYKTETFEIVGHINYQSRFDSTHLTDIYKLSERRAKAIYDYLVEYGIPATRMTKKGVGNSQPIFPSPRNDEERKKNMRVQIIIKK